MTVESIRMRVQQSLRHQDGKPPDEPPLPQTFRVVDMAAELQQANQRSQRWTWDGYIPHGFVSLLSAHGGAGKSWLALLIGACVSMGVPALGRATERARVLYVSGEDPATLVLSRLYRICSCLGFNLDDVGCWLQVIDTSELAPVLFTEARYNGVRHGDVTPTYEAISEYLRAEGFAFVVVDNASDTFDADEINRPMVRSFVRALARWAGPHGAVLLLSHVDKATSRAGKTSGSEAYTGSTAWNNSVRSRMFLLEHGDGELELQHQKCNLAPKLPPLRLLWPQDDVPQVANVGGPVAAIQRKNDTRALLALINEFYSRGEWVCPAHQSTMNAARMLGEEKGYPKHLKQREVLALLRDAQRDGFVEVEAYRNKDRKGRERWRVTAAGRGLTCQANA